MYINMMVEMDKNNLDIEYIAKILNIDITIVIKKLTICNELEFSEAKIIRDVLFPNMKLNYLFRYI
jgi:hypothetical protein